MQIVLSWSRYAAFELAKRSISLKFKFHSHCTVWLGSKAYYCFRYSVSFVKTISLHFVSFCPIVWKCASDSSVSITHWCACKWIIFAFVLLHTVATVIFFPLLSPFPLSFFLWQFYCSQLQMFIKPFFFLQKKCNSNSRQKIFQTYIHFKGMTFRCFARTMRNHQHCFFTHPVTHSLSLSSCSFHLTFNLSWMVSFSITTYECLYEKTNPIPLLCHFLQSEKPHNFFETKFLIWIPIVCNFLRLFLQFVYIFLLNRMRSKYILKRRVIKFRSMN